MKNRTRLRFLIGIFLGIQWQDLSNLWNCFHHILLHRFLFFGFGIFDREAPFHFWQPAIEKKFRKTDFTWLSSHFVCNNNTIFANNEKRCIFVKYKFIASVCYFCRHFSSCSVCFIFNGILQGLELDKSQENNMYVWSCNCTGGVPLFYYLESLLSKYL